MGLDQVGAPSVMRAAVGQIVSFRAAMERPAGAVRTGKMQPHPAVGMQPQQPSRARGLISTSLRLPRRPVRLHRIEVWRLAPSVKWLEVRLVDRRATG